MNGFKLDEWVIKSKSAFYGSWDIINYVLLRIKDHTQILIEITPTDNNTLLLRPNEYCLSNEYDSIILDITSDHLVDYWDMEVYIMKIIKSLKEHTNLIPDRLLDFSKS